MTTTQLTNREETEAEFARLGVSILTHREAAPRTNVAAWANLLCRLRGEPQLFSDTTLMTIYPDVFIPDDLWGDPFVVWEVLCHELVHWKRQRDRGLYKWVWWYVTSHDFRFVEEATAYLEDLRLGRRQVPYVVRALREDYGITKVTEGDMYAWFEANRAR